MENYRFAKHNLSDTVLNFAAEKGFSASKLRNTKYGYNYDNMLTILEKRSEMGNAKYDDLSVAVKLYDNIKKMSKAKRAKVNYDALKSRAKSVYEQLESRLVNDSPETISAPEQAAVIHTSPISYTGMLTEKKAENKGLLSRISDYVRTVPSRAAGKAKTIVIAGVAAAAIAAGVVGATFYAKHYNSNSSKPAATLESPKAPATSYATMAPPPYIKPNEDPSMISPPKPVGAGTLTDGIVYSVEAIRLARNIQGESKRNAVNAPETPAPVVDPKAPAPVVPTTTEAPKSAPVADPTPPTPVVQTQAEASKAPPAPKPVTKPVVEKPAECFPVSQYIAFQNDSVPYAPKPVVTQAPATTTSSSGSGNSNLTLKAILHDEAYADPHVLGDSATAKLILDSGNWGLDLYGNGFVDSEHYKDYTVDGTGARVWGGAHMYLPLSGKTLGFIEGNAGYEDRSYTVDFDSGSQLDFGNKGAFVNGKLGLTNGKLDDPENFGVGNKQNFVLLQGTKTWGDATGDFNGDYDAWRASAKGRLMLSPDFSAEAGVAGMHEEYGDSMSQDKITAEGGVRWHTSISGNPAFVEMLGIYQKLDSEINGSKSDDVRYGPQVGFGWRLASGDTVTLDATLTGGYLWSQEGDNEWRVMPGVTLYFGKKSK
jgi:hypothetical protein